MSDRPSLSSAGGPSDRVTVTVPVLGVVVEIFDRLADERGVQRGALMAEALEFFIRAHKDAEQADILAADPAVAPAAVKLFNDVALALDIVGYREGLRPLSWTAVPRVGREFVSALRRSGWVIRRVKDDPLEWFTNGGGSADDPPTTSPGD
jgi:hypothetical protein